MGKILILFLLLCRLMPSSALADVIVLKNGDRIDTQGTWEENGLVKYFKDGVIAEGIPKQDIEKIEPAEMPLKPEAAESDPTSLSGIDLKGRLLAALPPKNSIEKAGQATVTIQTAAGSGSGFFVTANGYIITNRHVIQGDPKHIAAFKAQLEAAEEQLNRVGSALKKERRRIDKMEEQLRTDRRYNTPDNLAILKDTQKAYRSRYNRFKKQKAALKENNRKYLHLKTNLLVQNTVDIILMDQTKLMASIERVSKDRDLALLRLSGYLTPSIELGQVKDVAQGDRLYAIGNPLNFSHSVSAGVFSGHQRGMLMTSAPINSGNSGGPLVTEDGKAVGINTMKIVGAGIEGIGFAIPIHTAINEFKDILQQHME